MTSLTRLRDLVDVVVGVDTHTQTHTAAIVDAKTGGVVEELTVPATWAGYQDLWTWVDAHSDSRAWAVEGTGSHGCGLTRLLTEREELVIELDRPVRAKRRHGIKSDKHDAIRAAREALSRDRLGTPRATGERQALAVLLAGRRSAVQAAGDTARQLLALIVAAPESVRVRFAGLTTTGQLGVAATLSDPPLGSVEDADRETRTTITVLRSLALRHQALTVEAQTHQRAILSIVRGWRADLLDQVGVGPINAATVLCAWSHPGRISSEAGFAMLAGVAPIPASSGLTSRHRLNRYGDRQLNKALHLIVTVRMRNHQPTRDYIARRTTEGKTPREIRRCLKRYVARDLYRLLEHQPALDAI